MKKPLLLLLVAATSCMADVLTIHGDPWTCKFDTSLHVPVVTWWDLKPGMASGKFPRTNKFIASPIIPGTNYNKDYVGTPYDKGHQCPAEDCSYSAGAEARCFAFDNMEPQAHKLNEDIWKQLEDADRKEVATKGTTIHVVCGGFSFHTTIGPDKIAVPDYCFKANLENGQWTAYIFPNKLEQLVTETVNGKTTLKPYTAYAVPVSELDTKLGFRVEDVK